MPSPNACRAQLSVAMVGTTGLLMLSLQREHRQQTSTACHLLFLSWCKLITLQLLKVKERIWALAKCSHTQDLTISTAKLRSGLIQALNLSLILMFQSLKRHFHSRNVPTLQNRGCQGWHDFIEECQVVWLPLVFCVSGFFAHLTTMKCAVCAASWGGKAIFDMHGHSANQTHF